MSANIDNEMKCTNDSSINIEVYRKLVQTYLNMVCHFGYVYMHLV